MIFKSKIIFIFLFIFFTTEGKSQSITWDKIYNRPNTRLDIFYGVCEADSGNMFLAGFSLIPSIGYKIWVVKINPHGDTIWTKTVGSVGSVAYSVASSGDGGCVLTGGAGEAFSIKIDRYGNVLWEKYYGGSGVQCYKILKTLDGGYIACGRINLQDGYILKLNLNGFFQWQKTFPINGFKGFNSMTYSKTYGFVLSGYELKDNDTARTTITRIDNNGNLIWEKKYTKGGGTILNISNGYIFGGTTSTVTATGKISIIKIDTVGNIFFEKIFDSTKYFSDLKIVLDSSENYHSSQVEYDWHLTSADLKLT